jgi:glycosyltransferase involved in cell wall biosynthesis
MAKEKMIIVTTVPITIKGILENQPRFLSKKFDITIVSSPDKELNIVSQSEGVPAYAVLMERGISPIKDILSIIKMINLLKKLKPIAVHSYTPKAGLVTMFAGFLCRVPVRIHTFTGLIFPTSSGIKQRVLILMDRLLCACATIIVPEGNGVKQDLIYHRITSKDLSVIGHGNIAGVNTDYFSKEAVKAQCLDESLLKILNFPTDAFVFCFVGRFTQDKGFRELINAFIKLPKNAYLLLVGEEDKRIPLPNDIKVNVDSNPRIYNLGWQDDVRPALAVSSVLVLPSYREGFPNTPLQAGSMQLPCIVTDVNGCNEIIEEEYNGWIIPAKNSLALQYAMQQSMHAENLEKLGDNARNNIQVKYEQSTHLHNMLKFYYEQFDKVPSQIKNRYSD